MEQQSKTILVVEDDPAIVDLLRQILGEEFRVLVASDGESALRLAQALTPPDLILLNVYMPGIDGMEVCRRLKGLPVTAGIPVIFVTAMGEAEYETRGFEVGAVDYITKPVNPPVVLARVRTHLELKEARDWLEDQNAALDLKVRKATSELVLTQKVTIQSLASLAETRDNETGGHIRRTQKYLRVLAEHLAALPSYAPQLPPQMVDLLHRSAPLHDIGKVGVRDAVLLKHGKLSPDEFDLMKKHTTYGAQAISRAEALFQGQVQSSFLGLAREIAISHHEKWDGSGYPRGLSGPEIPLSGRLMAVADVYDALISRRVYKPPLTHSQAVEIIMQGRGSQFDPELVDAFVAQRDNFRLIALQFADLDEERETLCQ